MSQHPDVSNHRTTTHGAVGIRWRLAICGLLAMLALPFAVAAERSPAKGENYSYEEELRVELTCQDGEKVRECVDVKGDIQFECVSRRGPLSRLWSALFGRREDDEVRPPTVVRDERVVAPDAVAGEAEASADRQGQAHGTPQESGQTVERKVVVRKGNHDLPACRAHG